MIKIGRHLARLAAPEGIQVNVHPALQNALLVPVGFAVTGDAKESRFAHEVAL